MRWLFLLILSLLLVSAAAGETVVRPDTTSGVIVAAGDSLYALPASAARVFDLNILPTIETTATANDTINIGDAYKAEFFTFGSAAAGGVYFKTVVSGGTRSVTAYVYIGAADSVKINAWQY